MWFENWFNKIIYRLNQKVKSDKTVQEALKKYAGRKLVFRVNGDADYVFYISENKIAVEVSPSQLPNDMYLEMYVDRAERLVYDHQVKLSDVIFGKIKRRNIHLSDIEFAKKIFGKQGKNSLI